MSASHRTVGTGKHTSRSTIGYQSHIRMGMTRHGQILPNCIRLISEILPLLPSPPDCNGLPRRSNAWFTSRRNSSRPFCPEILIRTPVAHGLAVQHHLCRLVGSRFQQQRIHIRMAGYSCGLSLHRLCPVRFVLRRWHELSAMFCALKGAGWYPSCKRYGITPQPAHSYPRHCLFRPA